MKSYKLIIPILNKKISLFKGITRWYLDDNIYIDKIEGNDFATIYNKFTKDYTSIIENDTKCIYIIQPEFSDLQNFIDDIIIMLRSIFNIFSEKFPILLAWAALLEEEKKLKLNEIIDFGIPANFDKLKNQHYKIEKNIKQDVISELFKRIKKSFDTTKNARFTLQKYNSFMIKSDILDKIVDATICLESLVRSNTELCFKFSLFLSFIAEPDKNKAYEIFHFLKLLYNLRSKIVHGDIEGRQTKKNIKTLSTELFKLNKYIKSCLTYYILFISERSPKEWEEHFLKIIYEIENKITD